MRPSLLNPLFADVTSLPGLGSKLAAILEEFTGRHIIDLLWHLPVNLIDRQYRPALSDCEAGRIATFELEVMQHITPRHRRQPWQVLCGNESGYIKLIFFRGGDWLKRLLPLGEQRLVSGRVERYRGEMRMAHPDYILSKAEFDLLAAFEPVYRRTAGLTSKTFLKAIAGGRAVIPALPEWQDADWLAKQGWSDWKTALQTAHTPQSETALTPLAPARARLAYDELLAHQLVLALARRENKRVKGRRFDGEGALCDKLRTVLPFTLTQAQETAITEIIEDMRAPYRMLRLLQGDVGAGKTLVALMAMLQAVESKAQAALMAPTELLARQHAANLAPLLDALGIRWQVFTGRNKGRARSDILTALEGGAIDIVIGTHALFQAGVMFYDLGLVVVDEQHRFGVEQRIALSDKGARKQNVDVLVMTATPIPRTLTLAAYGDMDVSRMTEKPQGRQPIDTRVMGIDRYDEIAAGLDRALKQGARVYWVCPLVHENEELDLAAAEARADALKKIYGKQVGLVHGQMPPEARDKVMVQFQQGKISILVATTVIEVGVDVPEATIMIIEHAERFGLAQLHQLRGRVGRSDKASSCILLYRSPLTHAAKERLSVMRASEDGFFIAEKDLALRGAGEVLGTRQSGLPAFRIADLEAHAKLLPLIYEDVREILASDSNLKSQRGEALRLLLYLFERDEAIKFLRSG